MKKLHLLLVGFVLCFSTFSWAQKSPCHVPIKGSRLAMDQRDDLRLRCQKNLKSRLDVTSCLHIASSMEYSNNAEEARGLCLYDLKKQPSLRECLAIAKSMEYPDSGDDARWECIRRFNRVLSKKECGAVAKKMSYPANEQRAKSYCDSELLQK